VVLPNATEPPPVRPVPALTVSELFCRALLASVVVPAAVRRPWASTVKVGTVVLEPYVPLVTAVLARLKVVVPPKATPPPPLKPVPAITVSPLFCNLELVTFPAPIVTTPAPLNEISPVMPCVIQVVPLPISKLPSVAIVLPKPTPLILETTGLGYVPDRSPPAAPVGAAPVIKLFDMLVIRPLLSTLNTGTCVASP